ncbi:polysaccharide biosynthesis/export family protein [bacterium]|jgi:hypothetical protein|nr:polysaccharide biosynthesis/export family protein [bacterium]
MRLFPVCTIHSIRSILRRVALPRWWGSAAVECFSLSLSLFLFLTLFPGMALAETPYILAPGDTLDIRFVNQKKLNTKQAIAPDGSISLPMLNRVIASGLDLEAFQKTLTTNYSAYIKAPQLTVFLTPRPIYVMQFDLRKDTWKTHDAATKAEALALIGPKMDFLIKRNGMVLNSKELKVTPESLHSTIQHGDVIEVSIGRRPDFFEDNWYKLITATAVLVSISNSLQ